MPGFTRLIQAGGIGGEKSKRRFMILVFDEVEVNAAGKMDIRIVLSEKIGDQSRMSINFPVKGCVQPFPQVRQRFGSEVFSTSHRRSGFEQSFTFFISKQDNHPGAQFLKIRREFEFPGEKIRECAPEGERWRQRDIFRTKSQKKEPAIRFL
ncbi:MAG: hypothetical protein ACK5PS_08575 [Desulfopila sp.]